MCCSCQFQFELTTGSVPHLAFVPIYLSIVKLRTAEMCLHEWFGAVDALCVCMCVIMWICYSMLYTRIRFPFRLLVCTRITVCVYLCVTRNKENFFLHHYSYRTVRSTVVGIPIILITVAIISYAFSFLSSVYF